MPGRGVDILEESDELVTRLENAAYFKEEMKRLSSIRAT